MLFRKKIQINFDGAMFGESDEVGLGVVVWNSKGGVLATKNEKIQKSCLKKIVVYSEKVCKIIEWNRAQ